MISSWQLLKLTCFFLLLGQTLATGIGQFWTKLEMTLAFSFRHWELKNVKMSSWRCHPCHPCTSWKWKMIVDTKKYWKPPKMQQIFTRPESRDMLPQQLGRAKTTPAWYSCASLISFMVFYCVFFFNEWMMFFAIQKKGEWHGFKPSSNKAILVFRRFFWVKNCSLSQNTSEPAKIPLSNPKKYWLVSLVNCGLVSS